MTGGCTGYIDNSSQAYVERNSSLQSIVSVCECSNDCAFTSRLHSWRLAFKVSEVSVKIELKSLPFPRHSCEQCN